MARLAPAAIAILVNCSAPGEPAPAPPRQAADRPAADRPVAVAPVAVVCCAEPVPARDQPPDVKLKLGHYRNARRGIGLVFDRTTAQAKLRFDGAAEIVKLDRQHGAGGRIDYIRRVGQVVLQQWDDGRVVVFVAGAEDGIDVRRDGDADPL
jgi:hypothetical protein